MKALERLLTYPKFGPTGVNERMEKLVQGLVLTPSIKVVGSNGKGSCATMIAQTAQNLGKKVGLYTSPHFFHVGERIKINGRPVNDQELEYILNWAFDRAADEKGCGRFEILTLAALYHFSQANVDLAVLEVGLGGRFDPVRVAPGQYSVLTSLDLEHTHILGDSLEAIAREKAAICKAGETLISAVQGIAQCVPEGVFYQEVAQPALSAQQSNARLAAHAVQAFFNLGYLVDVAPIRLTGRLHKIQNQPDLYIDVAHTAKAIESVLEHFKGRPVHAICAFKKDKDLKGLHYKFTHLTCLSFSDEMMSLETLKNALQADVKMEATDLAQALRQATETIEENAVILCFGGFEICSRMLAHIRGIHHDVISL